MKGKLTILSVVIGCAIYASANNFVVIVDKNDSVNYEMEFGYDDIIKYGEWVFNTECINDIEQNNIYYNKTKEQTSTCTEERERTVTTERVYDNGHKEILNTKIESEIINTTETKQFIIGTHLEETCKSVLENGYSEGNGIYHVTAGGGLTEAYCDMITNGGGWTAVWKNYGGPGSTATNTPALLSNNNSVIVKPKDFNNSGFASAKNINLYDYFKSRDNVEILKTAKAYSRSTGNEIAPFVSSYDISVPTTITLSYGNNVTFNNIINANNDIVLNDYVYMTLNGANYGKSKKMHHSSTSLGFANNQNDDNYGLPAEQVMGGWGARHVMYYTVSDGQNAVRCQPQCWSGSEPYNIETVWYFRNK
jgi:hypothetical protein